MRDVSQKRANWVSDALNNAAKGLKGDNSLTGSAARNIAELEAGAIENRGAGGLLRKALGLPLKAGKKVLDAGVGTAKWVAEPGAGIRAANSAADSVVHKLPGGGLLEKAEIPTLPLLLAGTVALPMAVRGDEVRKTTQRLNDAQALGETPMTDPFRGYVRQRDSREKRGHTREKQAGPSGLGRAARSMDILDGPVFNDILKKLLYKTKGEGKNVEHVLSLPKALGTGGAGLAGSMGVDAIAGDPDNPIEYKIQQALYDTTDRIQAEDEFAKSFFSNAGAGTANILENVLSDAAGAGADAAKSIPRKRQQQQQLQKALQDDEYLADATPEEKDMLTRAYGSMQKFAPELAGDEFAVKNYLRESLMSSNGPDYATISNLARANRDIQDRNNRRR